MRIDKDQKFIHISLHPSEEGKDFETTLNVVNSFELVIGEWNSGSRMSPIWRVQNDVLEDGGVDVFPTGFLFFVGMTNPAELEVGFFPRVRKETPSLRVLSSLGVFNIVLSVSAEEEAKVIGDYLDDSNFAFEEWELVDSVSHGMSVRSKGTDGSGVDFGLEKLKSDELKLKSKHVELATNTLAAARRGEMYFPWLEGDLEKVLSSYCESLAVIENCDEAERAHFLDVAYYRIINANSAISRFTSQALTGIQPIDNSEGHYWPHSALGVGIASNAVRNVAAFISARVGEFDFVQRVADLGGKPYPFTERPVDLTMDEMNADFLTTTPSTTTEKMVPICFFSGRDSFKHDVYSLSLPLETLEAATCHQWSLRTITHELTHRIIEPILGLLLPAEHVEMLDADGNSKLHMDYLPNDLLDAAKVGLLDSLMALARSQEPGFIDDANRDFEQYPRLYDYLIDFSDQAEEFMVHTFDFFYFYSRDPHQYVQSLWLSWGIIPHLEGKLDDYIARTIVALSANTLHLNDSIQEARRQFIINFETDYIKANNPHYETVLDRVKSDDYWASTLEPIVTAGSVAARFVVVFLYSDAASTHLYRDAALEAGDGYDVKKGEFSNKTYTNPLRLMQEFSTSEKVSAADSAWLFHLLTFNVGGFE
ncbi:hypothetical protein [Microbulbifer sp. S227A]|uniref:hypothetical protein n=1 Tax=Microbulbifer sp. S227A TaxID=3415131 RepID=UPI003C79B5CD